MTISLYMNYPMKTEKRKGQMTDKRVLQTMHRSRYYKFAPVAQGYHVTSDALGRQFDPGKRDFSH